MNKYPDVIVIIILHLAISSDPEEKLNGIQMRVYLCLIYCFLNIGLLKFLFVISSQIYSDGISPDSNYTLVIEYQEIEDADSCDPNL